MKNYSDSKPNEVNTDSQIIVEEKIVIEKGDVLIRKYLKGRRLGNCRFANYYELTCLDTNKIYAAKVLPKSSLVKQRAKRKLISEIEIHKVLKNPNIVGFEHFFEDTDNCYILIEMCLNQNLGELLKMRKVMTELEVQIIMLQLIKALKYLHSHRIIHRNLKLGNIFLTDEMELKVADFSLATNIKFDGERKRTICGTSNLIAPEILDGKIGYSYEVDVWSLGVILYTLLIGQPPFVARDLKTIYKRIKMNNCTFPEKCEVSEAAKSLITEILNSDPFKRPSLDAILNSDFFKLRSYIQEILPSSTLASRPSLSYFGLFMPDAGSVRIVKEAKCMTKCLSNNKIEAGKETISNKFSTDRNNLGECNYNIKIQETRKVDSNLHLTTNYMSKKVFLKTNFLIDRTKKLKTNVPPTDKRRVLRNIIDQI
jgi:polo-like kinase 1